MKKSEFIKERKVQVSTDQGTFEFTSYDDMIGNFEDVTNSEQWAYAHHSEDGESCVCVAHRFDPIGEIIENHMTRDDAVIYTGKLNDYYAIHETYCIEEL